MNTGYASGLGVSKKNQEWKKWTKIESEGLLYGKDLQERFQEPHFLF